MKESVKGQSAKTDGTLDDIMALYWGNQLEGRGKTRD